MANIIETANLSIDDTVTTTRGTKMARIRDGADQNCIFMPKAKLRVPFAPSSFDAAKTGGGNNRLNLQLSVDDAETVRELQKFDRWLIEYLAEHSERILKRKLTKEQVEAGYLSCLKPGAKDLPPLLKTKIDLEGRHAVHCWDQDGNDKGQVPPDEWRGSYIEARVHISHLWQMANQYGVVMRLTDANLADAGEPPKHSCPF